MENDRDLSFDAFRGLAIIAVVAIHANFLAFSYRNSLIENWNFLFPVAYGQLLTFAIPAFVFVSGYWLSKKPLESLEDYKTFMIKRLYRVLIPYFFWSFTLLGIAVVRTHHIDIYKIIFKLMTGRACSPYYPYYFIVMIASFYLVTPVFHYINRKRYGLILVLILNVMSLLILYLSNLFEVIWHLPDALPFYSWIIFYEIGLLTGGRDNKIFVPKKIRSFILPAILVSLLISELEGIIILSKYNNVFFAVSMTKYSSFLYSACIIFGFLLLRERFTHWPKFLVKIGNHSFGIFFIHMMVLVPVFKVIQQVNVIRSFPPLYQLVIVSITISICLVMIGIAHKLLPKYFCNKVLGF